MGEIDAASRRPYFIVRNELDAEDVLLQSYLEGGIQYQRQQETLIVWTDLAGKDLALSFQENEGCADLCDFIVRVQQENLSPSISLYYVVTTMSPASASSDGPREITELIAGPIAYPPDTPTRDSLPEMLELMRSACNSMYLRYKVSAFLIDSHYFDRLFALFLRLEKSHDLEGLHCLNDIIKIALYFSEIRIVEELVSTEARVMGVVGILEYDRNFPDFKACHRDYLMDESRLKTVIDIPLPTCGPIDQMDIFRKDFVLQYLKNVVLPRNSEESALNLLSGMIHNNQIEIIDFLIDSSANDNFLQRLFDVYDPLSSASRTTKHDGVRLLHQYVFVAKTSPSNQSADFFNSLVNFGLLKMVKFALSEQESSLRVLGIEILTTVIDQDVSLVNLVSNENKEVDELENIADHPKDSKDSKDSKEHEDPEAKEQIHEKSESIKLNLMNDMSLTLILGKLLLNDQNPALKIQTYEAIKNLLCSTVFDLDLANKEESNDFAGDDERINEHGMYVKRYFEAFYQQVAPTLFQTFIELATGSDSEILETQKKLQHDPILFQHLCDLISFCCHEHQSSIFRPFFTKSRALEGIVKILNLNVNVTLKLGVLRCFKSLILLDDHALCYYMIEHDLFEPFFKYFETVANENSLPNSSCLDLLEIIIRRSLNENFGCLAAHISQNYKAFLESKIEYVSTGRDLLASAKKFKERMKDITVTSVDVDQEYLRDPQPSSPISRDFNGFYQTEGQNECSQSYHDAIESLDQDDSFSKRKRENFPECASEKRTCKVERERMTTARQEDNPMEEEANPRGMTT
ncbi:hypothetical protein JCM33374_g2174 [Metschnikowia sp. JCM 33374]|nr:hypothetical protein JCM33374_g2174 [Metschnikowia sp. JCM 33374]